MSAAGDIGHVELTNVSDPERPEETCGVVEVYLKDGRQFTMLAATPAWFRAELMRQGLRYYYGPAVLFLRRVDLASARKAAKAMRAESEQLLVRYDTPRRTLPDVLAAFKASRSGATR